MTITIELTRDQWGALLRAADNGAGAQDAEAEISLFPHFATRKAFRTAFTEVETAIGARYGYYSPDDTPREE